MIPYYEHAGIIIYHGDCRDILPTLDVRVDVVLTDPPFNVPVRYHASDGEYPRSWGDLLVMEPFFKEVFKELRRVTKDAGHVYVHCDADTYPVFFKAAYSIWPDSHLLVWYKPTGRRGRGWLHSHELILHLRDMNTAYASGFRQDVIGVMPVRTLNREHPAEKPGQLLDFLMEAVTVHPALILDPFMGGGTTLFAAKRSGNPAIGIEIEERYCEIAAKRLAQEILPI